MNSVSPNLPEFLPDSTRITPDIHLFHPSMLRAGKSRKTSPPGPVSSLIFVHSHNPHTHCQSSDWKIDIRLLCAGTNVRIKQRLTSSS